MNNVQITGLKEVIQKINKIKSNVKLKMPVVIDSGLKGIRNDSINYLSMISHTVPGPDAIRDINNWSITKVNNLKSTLTANSSHSAKVEFGGYGTTARNYLGATIASDATKKKILKNMKDQLTRSMFK